MRTPFDKPKGLLQRLMFPALRVAYLDGVRTGASMGHRTVVRK